MKNDELETRLKDSFSGMRAEDEANAPSFESCTSSPAARTLSYSPIIWRLAASFALIAFVGAGVLKLQNCSSNPSSSSPSQELQQEKWASISSWQAGTDNLLTMTDTHLDGSFTTGTDLLIEGSL